MQTGQSQGVGAERGGGRWAMTEAMGRDELELWLCGPGARVPTHAELAAQVGLPLSSIGDTTLLRTERRLRCLRFVLAVLRDVYADDEIVRQWLREPRIDLDGRSALDALRGGRLGTVEELAVREWHRPWRSGRTRLTEACMPV